MLQETAPTGAAAFLAGAVSKGTVNRMDSIPPVPPTLLKRVHARDFDAYLAS